MIKKGVTVLIFCFFLSISAVYALFILSNRPNLHKNGFLRKSIQTPINLIKSFELGYNSYYLSGYTNSNIYLGNAATPNHILIIDSNLSDSVHLWLKASDSSEFYLNSCRVIVDSPNIFYADGNIPVLFHSSLYNSKIERFNISQKTKFINLLPISLKSFFYKAYDYKQKQYNLVKENLGYGGFNIIPSKNILQKKVDGIFCTDGMLNYDSKMNWLTYVYYYRNDFVCFDTNFNIIYKGKTIDTISTPKIKIAKIKSESKITMKAPPLLVNEKSCIDNGKLFIESSLVGDNEQRSILSNNVIIDAYSMSDGKYQLSFYLPKLYRKKPKNISIKNNKLYALYEHTLCVYELPL